MTQQIIHWKGQSRADIEGRISALRLALDATHITEPDRAKRIARKLQALIKRRNAMRTPDEVHRIERSRGLAS